MQIKKFLGGVVMASSAIVTVGLLGPVPALADSGAVDVLEAIATASPDTANSTASLPTKATGESAIDATVAGADVVVPVDPADGIRLDTVGGGLSVSLPFAHSADGASVEKKGVVSYDNNNGSITVPLLTKDGALQINTVVSNASAPKRYSYGLTIPEGGQVVDADGGYFIVNADRDPIAYIAPPWAKDANGASVPTHFQLTDNTLTQVVDFTVANAFPVVADPQFAWYGVLPSVQLTRNETKTASTLTGMATVCGWVTRLTGYAGGSLCGLNAGSIIINAQRIYYNEKRCAQLLIGPGAVATIGYSGGYCR